MKKPKIMIDAGHGGGDSGAVGPGGLKESNVTLSVAMLLGSLLVGDFEVNYTRRDDTFVELGRRAILANDWQADAFISIHCNAGPPGQGAGFEVFTSVGETDSDAMATDVFGAFGAEFPGKARRMDMRDGDVDKEAGFTVIKRTHMKALLFELEFIHTSAGESWLAQNSNQAACARALAAGLRKHFGLATSDIERPASSVEVEEKAIPIRDLVKLKLGELQTLVAKL